MAKVEQCGNVLEEDGQRFLCQLPRGHSKEIPHESGDWEWWDSDDFVNS